MPIKTLGEVARYINGRAFKPIEWENVGLPIIRIQNLTNTNSEFNRTSKRYNENFLVKDGDLLFAWSASLGAHIWHGGDAWLNQHIFKVIPNAGINKMYLYYYLIYLIDILYAKTHGSGMVHITMQPFKMTKINIPSIQQQNFLTNRIESLFSKLDEAKQRIQDVLDSFEVRKAAILHQAFTGKLTAKWRKEHGIENDSWINTPFEDCIYEMQNGLSKRHGDIGEKVSVLRLANILDYGVSVTDLRQIVLNNKEKSTYLLDKGDALMVRVNGSKEIVGKQIMISKDREWAFCDHLIRIKYEPKRVLSKYMVYYSKTQRYREYIEDNMVSSAGQNTISRKGMAHLEVQLPTLPEQIEILQILEDQIGKQQQTKEIAERTLVQIDLLKKSILARAFRG
jgi:type I restriction enzyme S subunit